MRLEQKNNYLSLDDTFLEKALNLNSKKPNIWIWFSILNNRFKKKTNRWVNTLLLLGNVDPNKDVDYDFGIVSVKPQDIDN